MAVLTSVPAKASDATRLLTVEKIRPSNVIAMQPRDGVERRAFARPDVSRRRPGSAQQGRALEVLGHAVEYLMDSRMFLVEKPNVRAEQEAVQILMRMSRAVFAECPKVVSIWQRLRRLWRGAGGAGR